MPDPMQVIVSGRRSGKTTKTLEWVKEARRVPHYPFWDRVLIVATFHEAQVLRIGLRQEAEEQGIDESGLYYNLVYSIQEWKNAYIDPRWEGLVAIDNAEFILEQILRQRPALVTMTGVQLPDTNPSQKGT